jgi:DNA-binding transcriptional regulator YdaS (Cro superfamily)
MTPLDLDNRLEQAISERNDPVTGKGGAAQVARMLGISDSHLSQYRKGTYTSPGPIREKIREVLGGETVECPELGEISLADCSALKRRAPTTDSYYARMFRACKKCPHSGGKP